MTLKLSVNHVVITVICKNILTRSEWPLQPNVDKFSTLHLVKGNLLDTYCIGKTPLSHIIAQNYLGVTITSDRTWSNVISNIVEKTNSMLFLLKKTFTDPGPQLTYRLYTTYFRTIIEFAAPVQNPWLAGDKDLLKKVLLLAGTVL